MRWPRTECAPSFALQRTTTGCVEHGGEGHRVGDAHHQLSQSNRKPENIPTLRRVEADLEDSISRPIHEPPACEPMDSSTDRSLFNDLRRRDCTPRERGAKGPAHSNVHLAVADVDVRARWKKSEGARKRGIPAVEENRNSLRAHVCGFNSEAIAKHPRASRSGKRHAARFSLRWRCRA